MAEENKKTSRSEIVYSVHQACNLFRLHSMNRRVAMKKHEGEEHTEKDWKKIFKSDNFII